VCCGVDGGVVVKDGAEDEDAMEIEETEESLAAGRFVDMFLRHLLRGIDAKEKFVRLRVCQLIALAMNSLGEIEYPSTYRHV
jgi:condensin complex subunit 3